MQWMANPCSVQKNFEPTQRRGSKTTIQERIQRHTDFLVKIVSDDSRRNSFRQVPFHAAISPVFSIVSVDFGVLIHTPICSQVRESYGKLQRFRPSLPLGRHLDFSTRRGPSEIKRSKKI